MAKSLQVCPGAQVGKDLEEAYWRPGNGAAFLDLVQGLTGQPLSADAWVSRLQQSVSSIVQQEEHEYQQAVKQGPKLITGQPGALTLFCLTFLVIFGIVFVVNCKVFDVHINC